jgi:cell division protein FtsB
MSLNASRVNRQRLRVIGIGMVLMLALWAAFSPFGIVRYLKVEKQLAEAEQKISRLEVENRSLEEEIERLENDPAYIGEVARKRYGLIKKNEMIFDFGKGR